MTRSRLGGAGPPRSLRSRVPQGGVARPHPLDRLSGGELMELSQLDQRTQRVGFAALIASPVLAAIALVLGSLNSSWTGFGGPNYWYFTRGGESLVAPMITMSGLLFTLGAVFRWKKGVELALGTGIAVLAGGVALLLFLPLAYDTTTVFPGGVVVTQFPNFPWGFLVTGWAVIALLLLPLAGWICRRFATRFAPNAIPPPP